MAATAAAATVEAATAEAATAEGATEEGARVVVEPPGAEDQAMVKVAA